MFGTMKSHISEQLRQINEDGLYKTERIITSPQSARIAVQTGQTVVNLCANNYLGLANHPEIVQAARESYDRWGYGLSSVRFICGTQEIHKQLEKKITEFLGTEDTILYCSCFDANTGLFETLLTAEDAVISDRLNHASIIDGIRLCKAQRLRFENSDMEDLEDKLKQAQSARFRLIATDGVFSMDGTIAKLDQICRLADKYDALVMVDDSHAVGVLGESGRGTHEYHNVDPAPALPSLSFLEHAGAGHRRHLPESPGHIIQLHGFTRQAAGQHPLFQNADNKPRTGRDRRRAPDRADYARRRPHRPKHGREAAGKRPLRDRILISCGSQGSGTNSHADIRGSPEGGFGLRHCKNRRGQTGIGDLTPSTRRGWILRSVLMYI